MSSQIRFDKIFWLRPFPGLALASFLLFTLQQLVAASSSWFLVRMINAITDGQNWQVELGFLLASVTFPYLPGALANTFIQIWILKSQQNLWQTFISSVKGRSDLLNTYSAKESYLGVFKEIFYFIEESLRFSGNFVATFLNFSLNLIIVSGLLGKEITIGLLLSFLLILFQFFFMSRIISKLARNRQASLGELDRIQMTSWQNLVVNNNYNYNRFNARWEHQIQIYKGHFIRSALLENLGSVGLSMISFIPTILSLIYVVATNSHDTKVLLTVAALLPRVFAIWNVTSNLFLLAQQIPSLKGRWEHFQTRTGEFDSNSRIESRISNDLISIRDQKSQEPLTLSAEHLKNGESLIGHLPQTGWLTLAGSNGVGKSSLLLSLKKALGEKAFYLPAHVELDFSSTENQSLSTGQKMKECLLEISQSMECPTVLLLDEWDANLDSATRTELFAHIECLSLNHLIIDTRHRT